MAPFEVKDANWTVKINNGPHGPFFQLYFNGVFLLSFYPECAATFTTDLSRVIAEAQAHLKKEKEL